MKQWSLSPLRLFLLAILGSVIVLGGAIVAVIALWQPRPLSAFLPAQNTVAFFANVTREDVRQWSDTMPGLQSVPVFDGALDLGILKKDDGSVAWVLSSRKKDQVLPSSNGRVLRQDVLLSDPLTLSLLTGDGIRLRADDSFVRVKTGIAEAATSLYFAHGGDSITALPTPVQAFLRSSGALLLADEDHTMIVRMTGQPAPASATIHSHLPILSPAPDMTLSLGNPQGVLKTAISKLSPADQLIQEGILAHGAEQLLGGEWSYAYDIAPLFEGESSLSWKTGTGATPSFLLLSTTENPREIQTRLSSFHDHFRSELTGTVVSAHALDHGLASATLKSDPSKVEDVSASRAGWTLRLTHEVDGGRILASAVRGRQFAISNNKEWMDALTSQDDGSPVPSVDGVSIAGGILSPARADSLLNHNRNQPGWTWLLRRMAPKTDTIWGMETKPGVLTLTLKGL